MPPMKYFFILSPNDVDDAIKNKAISYYGEREYSFISDRPELMETIRQSLQKGGLNCNAELLLIGSAALAMAMSNSVYVTKDWESNDYCKICHALAFSHGLEIVYET